jgi:hypothetical protein
VAAAACEDGLPEHGSYKDILRMADSAEALLALIESPDFSEHDQWQVQIQAQIQRKARVYLRTDGLTDEQVRAAHLTPCADVERQVRELLAEAGPGATLAVLPQGPQTIPYVAPPAGSRPAASRSRARRRRAAAVVGGSE